MSRLILLFILLFSQCESSTQRYIDLCEKNNVKSSELISQFYMDNDTLHLDSALIYIDEIYQKCDDLKGLLSLRKLSIYSMKKDYSKALLFINTFNDGFFGDLTYFKNFLLNRFNAMRFQDIGDLKKRNDYLKFIVNDLEGFLVSNEGKVNSLFKLSDVEEILRNPISTPVIQYYYYKAMLEGTERTEAKLKLREKTKGGNKEFYEFIKTTFQEDFMIYIGF